MPHKQRAFRARRIISLVSILFSCSTPHAFAQSSTRSDPNETITARFERLKKEINALKKENDENFDSILRLEEMNRCLNGVVSSISELARQLNDLGGSNAKGSFSDRSRILTQTQSEFFDSLSEFSRNGLDVFGSSNAPLTSNSPEMNDLVAEFSVQIHKLRNQYEAQASDEQKFLGDVSLAMRRLKNASFSAQRSLQSAQTCAPQVVEKTRNMLDVSSQVLNNFEKSRALIAELQLKRSRVLGAVAAGFQKKITARLANTSGDAADHLIASMNATLAELSLLNEVEKWWFSEALEKGPARGFLQAQNQDPLKAVEILKLAIARCDDLMTRVKEVNSAKNLGNHSTPPVLNSGLETTLYQRREALNRWLVQAENSLKTTTR